MTTQSYKALKGVGKKWTYHKPLLCVCVYKANTKGNWWSPDQGFLGCLKWKSLFINLTNTYPYGMCLDMHRQPVKFPTLIAQPMLSVIIHSVIPISSTWSVRQKRKGGEIRHREKASYPYANMQIRALLGSLHVIEVRHLSVESMDNIRSHCRMLWIEWIS